MHTLLRFSPLLLLLAATSASAQSFTIDVTPPQQTVQVGQKATYTIRALPEGGFGASVFLNVSAPTLNPTGVALDRPNINVSTSTEATLTIAPSGGDIGTHAIVIEGKNGAMVRYDTIMLRVTANADADQWTYYHSGNSDLRSEQISGIAFDKTGNTWIGTRQGVVRAAPGEAPRLVAGPFEELNISAIGVDSANAVWVITAVSSTETPTLGRYFNGEWTIHEIPTEALDSGFYASSIATAPDGSVWFGGRAVILRIKDGVWTMFTSAEWGGIINTEVEDMVVTPEGDLWVVSNNRGRESSAGLLKFDGTFWTGYSSNDLRSGDYLYDGDLAIDDSSRVWLSAAAENAIVSPNAPGVVHRTVPFTPTEIAAGSNGQLWMSAGSSSYIRLAVEEAGAWRDIDMEHSGIPTDSPIGTIRIAHLAVHPNGTVWAGTMLHGIAVLRPRAGTVGVPAIERPASADELLVLPNPLALRLVSKGGAGHISLHNTVGEKVAVLFDGTIQPGEMTLPLDLSNMSNGAYIVTVTIDGKVPTSRMMMVVK